MSKWKYDQDTIDARNETCTYYPDKCKDENWFVEEFDDQFRTKFGLNRSFPYVFLDSWSQGLPDIHDEVQQEHWQEEAAKLWEFSNTDATFTFMTIDDVLEENAAYKEENERLHKIINEDLSKLKTDGKSFINLSQIDI